VRVWELENFKELFVLRGHMRAVRGVTFSPDGKRLASVDQAGYLKVWDATHDPAGLVLPRTSGSHVNAVAFTADSRQVLATDSPDFGPHHLGRWDAADGHLVEAHSMSTRGGFGWEFVDAAFTPNSRFYVGAAKNAAGADVLVRVWDLAEQKELITLEGHSLPISSVAITPDGRRVVSSAWARTDRSKKRSELRVWDVATGKVFFSRIFEATRGR
jgi:WD40 repeat protein